MISSPVGPVVSRVVGSPFARHSTFPPILTQGTAWWRGDKLITLNGSTVSAWGDLTGNGNNATQGTEAGQPDFNSSLLNGKPGLVFDGATEFIAANSAASVASGEDEPFSVFWVGRLVATGDQFIWSFGDLSGTEFAGLRESTGNFAVQRSGSTGGLIATSSASTDTEYHIIIVVFNGLQVDIHIDGVKEGDALNLDTGSIAVTGFTWAALRRSTVALHGNIEMIEGAIFPDTITAAEVDTINQYASDRYGIALS